MLHNSKLGRGPEAYKLAKVGSLNNSNGNLSSYAVGDVRALVPARKVVWSLPGEPKASGNTFFLLPFFYCISYYLSGLNLLTSFNFCF